jgi:FkbH-like protein
MSETVSPDPLDYPFDVRIILRTRKALRAQLLRQEALTDLRVAILGGSTTSEIRSIAELFLLRAGFRPEFFESEYGKYFEDVLVDDSALRRFRPQVAFVHTTHVNLLHAPALFAPPEEIERAFTAEFARYQAMWSKLCDELGCLVIQNNFDLPPVRSLGGLDSTEAYGRTNFLTRLNLEFARVAREAPKLIINDIHYLSARIGLDRWFDADYWFSYKMAVSHEGTVHLAHALAVLVSAAFGKTRKCLVLDLDNTVWGGVIGDDGLPGIKVGKETAEGEAFSAFQQYCEELRQRGILLAANSKNDLKNAQEGLSHPDMILRLDSFAAFQANWGEKTSNLRQISKDLNLGLDSLVFVDDNPVEREFVRTRLPEVAVPEIGSEVSRFPGHLDRLGLFEVTRLSGDDAQRASFYALDEKRAVQQVQFADYGEFLASLDMRAEVGSFTPLYLERICQLTNKTNQFNLTTKRLTLAEMEEMGRRSDIIGLYGRLTDKFGDNGLVTVLAGRLAGQQLHIDLWLMSCRVLKRELEYTMLDVLVARAAERGVSEIFGYYARTARNDMVAEHYRRMGFELISATEDGAHSVWRLVLTGYEFRNRRIKLVNNA